MPTRYCARLAGLVRNCIAPCKLSPAVLSRFLAALQPVRAGGDVTLVCTHDGLDAYYNGISAGHISDPQFTQLMLAVFIGQNVTAPPFKAGTARQLKCSRRERAWPVTAQREGHNPVLPHAIGRGTCNHIQISTDRELDLDKISFLSTLVDGCSFLYALCCAKQKIIFLEACVRFPAPVSRIAGATENLQRNDHEQTSTSNHR